MIKVGFFSFTGCEGCMVVFVEMLNGRFFRYKGRMDIVQCRLLKTNKPLSYMDYAFVEGAISTIDEEKRLRNIRDKTDKLISIGSCACTGGMSAQRNDFSDEKKKSICKFLRQFNQLDKVKSLKDVVAVDADIDGCPVDESRFVKMIDEVVGLA